MKLPRRRRAVDPSARAQYDAAWSAWSAGQQQEGIELLRRALDVHEISAWWFDLGLMHKWRQEWPASLAANLRSAELDPGNEPAYWNGGIAATALHDWPVARRMWAAYGVTLPDGEGEPHGSLGSTPVRVDLDGATEVVWCERLDPARALIENVPTPDCARRWHDVVLMDGEPKGERRSGDEWVPVFDEISLWRPAELPKLRVVVHAGSPAEVELLVDRVRDAGRGAEDWTSEVQVLCRECSEGRPDPSHDHPPMDDWSDERSVGLGCEPDVAAGLLDAWVSEAPDRRDRGLVEAV